MSEEEPETYEPLCYVVEVSRYLQDNIQRYLFGNCFFNIECSMYLGIDKLDWKKKEFSSKT